MGSQCRGSGVLPGLRRAVLARGPHAGGDGCPLRLLPPEHLAGLPWTSGMAQSHGQPLLPTIGWWLCRSWGIRCLRPAWQCRGSRVFYVVAGFPRRRSIPGKTGRYDMAFPYLALEITKHRSPCLLLVIGE